MVYNIRLHDGEREKKAKEKEKLGECFSSLCNRLTLLFSRLLFGMLSNRR